MNRRLNEYSLQVYRVVCLVIVLCCVWCSASSDSEDDYVYEEAHAIQQANRIVDMIVPLLNLHIIQEKRIFASKIQSIRQYLDQLVEVEGRMSQNLNQSSHDYFDPVIKEYERIIDRSPSLVVREVLIQKSAAIIARKLLGYINGCLDGKYIRVIRSGKIEDVIAQVRELNDIKFDRSTLETQLQTNKLRRTATEIEIEEKIAKIEIKVIELAKHYDSNALYERYNEAEEEEAELNQFLEKEDHTTILELAKELEENVGNRTSKDVCGLVASVGAVIDTLSTKIQELDRDKKP
ncbi:hypothetical protein NEHOM01_2394, partial [Nematocida homosporus]